MRELKFRQWDTESRVFGYFDNGNQDWIFDWDSDDPIMQWIGSTDRKNVNIYEGDIVKDGCGDVAVVIWCVNSASFKFKYSAAGILAYTDSTLDLEDFGVTPEVIGNIYENPELVEKL